MSQGLQSEYDISHANYLMSQGLQYKLHMLIIQCLRVYSSNMTYVLIF